MRKDGPGLSASLRTQQCFVSHTAVALPGVVPKNIMQKLFSTSGALRMSSPCWGWDGEMWSGLGFESKKVAIFSLTPPDYHHQNSRACDDGLMKPKRI